jgi:hypothetical protein
MDTAQGSGARASSTNAEERKRSLDTHHEEEGARRRRIELQDEDGGEKRIKEEAVGEEDRLATKAMVAGLEVNQEDEELPALAESEYDEDEYYDDKTGRALEPRLVEKAEAEEIDYMMKLEVGQEVNEQECWTMTVNGASDNKVRESKQGHRGVSRCESEIVRA